MFMGIPVKFQFYSFAKFLLFLLLSNKYILSKFFQCSDNT